MIKMTLVVGTVVVGVAFAAGCYVGWKTTMKAMEIAWSRKKAAN